MKLTSSVLGVVGALAFSTASATVVTETFEGFGGSGTAVNTFSGGTVQTLSNGNVNQAIIFDTNDFINTDDGDLNANLTRRSTGMIEDLGNVLIISENAGNFLPADDEGDGGQIAFNFFDAVTVQSLDFIDTGENAVTVSFFDVAVDLNASLPLAIATFVINLDLDTNNNQPNFFDTFFFGANGVSGVQSFVVDFGSNSGAIDNLKYLTPVTPVPVPAALPLMLAGLAGAGFMRRKARRA